MIKTDFFTDCRMILGERIDLSIQGLYKGTGESLPFYWFSIIDKKTGQPAGKISLRLGQGLTAYWDGNIGYEVNKLFQGQGFAYEACLLLFPLALRHGFKSLYLTCGENNIASFKTIEKLGGKLLETSFPPKDYIYYRADAEKTRIYQLNLLEF